MAARRLVQRGGGVTGVEGDFGSEHKGKRGGVTVEGKGSEGRGGLRGDESALFCCANVTRDCYGRRGL